MVGESDGEKVGINVGASDGVSKTEGVLVGLTGAKVGITVGASE